MSAPGQSAELLIGGTGAAIGVLKNIATEYRRANPGAQVRVLPSLGSGGGIKAVLKGRISLGISARPLKAAERDKGAVADVFARTAFVFATSEATAHGGRGFSAAEIVDVYAHRLRTWPGGEVLRPILRPNSDSDSTALKRDFPGMDEVLAAAHDRRGALVSFTDQSTMDDLQQLPGTLSTATLCAILGEQRPLHVFPIDGVPPTTATLADGRYPYTKTLYFVTDGAPDSETQRFLDFIQSPAVSNLLPTLGLLPE